MASIIALFLIVAAAYVVVFAGGIAFELTGVDREMARFQALSCFTGTGFTTQAAERIVEHRMRRRIATTLIVLGYAGAASVIATLMRSISVDSLGQSFAHLAGGLVMGIVTLVIMRLYSDRILDRIRVELTHRLFNHDVVQENLFRAGPGLGVARVLVPEHSGLLGRPLKELDLASHGLTLLLFETEDHTYHQPDANSVLVGNTYVLVFGRLDEVEEAFAPAD